MSYSLRHQVIELDSNGNTVTSRSGVILDHGDAMSVCGALAEAEPDAAGFEVYSWQVAECSSDES